MIRPSWDEWGLALAEAVSSRADCSKSKVGAVLLSKDHRVLAVGYNGTPSGSDISCLKGDCPRTLSGVAPGSSYDSGVGKCISTHAEISCLLFSDFSLRSGSSLYITREPCFSCSKVLACSGILRAVWPEGQISYGTP